MNCPHCNEVIRNSGGVTCLVCLKPLTYIPIKLQKRIDRLYSLEEVQELCGDAYASGYDAGQQENPDFNSWQKAQGWTK